MDPGETIDSLRVHVRRGLDRFCLGQYFTEYGLQETAVLIPEDANADDLEACGLTDKTCPFQVFLKAVASEIVKEKGVLKGRKKRIKDYLEILQAFAGEWVDYIRKNMRKKLQNKSSNLLGSPSSYHYSTDAHHKASKTATASAATETGDAAASEKAPKKKGGKRGPRGPYKKRKPKDGSAAAAAATTTSSDPGMFGNGGPPTSSNTIVKKKKSTAHGPTDIESARRDFDAQRSKVMEKIPDKNKRLFGEVGFAKWGKGNLPAMALNPYHVPPGDIRDQWLKMFQNVVDKDRISKMGHLVWWIGPATDGQSSYSVVPSHGFLTYDEGAKNGLHELPPKIKKLIDRGKELNRAQQETMEALRLLNELALQPVDEREHPRSDFMEEDYWGLEDEEEEDPLVQQDDDEMDEIMDNNEEDEELIDDEEDLVEKPSSKKKKGKKRKKEEILDEDDDDDDDEIMFDDDMEDDAPAKKKKNKDKTKLDRGRKKKKKKSIDNNNLTTMEQEGVATADEEISGEQSANANATGIEFVDASAVAALPIKDDAALLEEESVSGDSALVDSDYGGDEFGDAEDEQLVGVDVHPGAVLNALTMTSKTKKLKKAKKKSDSASNDSDDKASGKLKKKKKKKDKKVKEPKKRSKAAEQRELERCEEEYLPAIEELQMANEMKDVSLIQQCLDSLLPVAESFSASFFSEYEIPKVMKGTKRVLEEAENKDLSTYKKLWNIMKASYAEKFKLLPEGFQGKKKKGAKSYKDTERVTDDEQQQQQQQPTKSSAVKAEAPVSFNSQDTAEGIGGLASAVKSGIKEEGRRLSVGSIKEEGRRLSVSSVDQALKSVEKAPPTKPKPKKFSVMDFMNKKKENKRVSSGGVADKAVSSSSVGSAIKRKIAPSWVTAPLPTPFDNFIGCDSRDDRLFAMEFLIQAAAHFPADKGVNEESVARSLELAIYEWSQSKGKWSSETYWDKVHAIVAAITGKRDVGTLIGMIMEGSFASPKSIIELSVENLEHSFEGRPLSLSGE